MNSSRKVFFYLLLVVTMIVAGVVMQFLLAQSKNQTTVNAKQIYALQQVHADTPAISNDLYLGKVEAAQQLQTHQKVMEKRLRQFNQQSGLLQSKAARKAASDDSVELNHVWFALSQLLITLSEVSPKLIAQRESKNQLVVSASEVLTKIDGLALALGRESRLKDSVNSALSYVDLMAEVSVIRSSAAELQNLVQKIGGLDTEPSGLSQNVADQLKMIETGIELLAKDSDRVVKSKLIELLESRDAFVAERNKWLENLPLISEAFLTNNAIQQRSEDFNLQLNAKLRSGGESQHDRFFRLLAYALPVLGAIFLLIGGRRYIQSTATHLSIAHGSTEVNDENVQQTEKLKQQLVSMETQKEQLEANLQAQGQKMQSVTNDANRYLSDLQNFTSKLDDVETDAKDLQQQNETLEIRLQESLKSEERYRLEATENLNELKSTRLGVKELERKNLAMENRLQESESTLHFNESNISNELESTQQELADLNEKTERLAESFKSAELRATELQTLNDRLESDMRIAEENAEKYQIELSNESKELGSLNVELEKLSESSQEVKNLLEAKTSDYEGLKKEKLQLDFELEAQQQEFGDLLSELERVEDDFSQRLELDSETTHAIATKINGMLDVFSDNWREVSLLAEEMGAVSLDVQESYLSDVVSQADVSGTEERIETLQAASDQLVESLNKLSLGGKASSDIVAETSEMSTQGVGSMQVINEGLDSTASTINGMLPSLERLTENSQLMKSVVELLDSISEQAQSLDDSDVRTGLDITANDQGVADSKYDLFENFRMATGKMTELISEVLGDVEGLARSIEAGMNDVQDSSVHAIAMAKLMNQVNVSQSQLNRLIQALLTQTDVQTKVVRDFSDKLSEIPSSEQEAIGDNLNKETVEQLVELSDQLKNVTKQGG